MSRAGARDKKGEPAQAAAPPEPPGTFVEGRRVTTPSGKFMPQKRPVSQLAARLRGICTGSMEDFEAAMSPAAVSCGSPSLARSELHSRGSCVSVPPGYHSRTQITRQQKPVKVPRLNDLSRFMMAAAHWTKLPCKETLQLAPECNPDAVRRVFEPKGEGLQIRWQRQVLASQEPLHEASSVLCGIENITEQDQPHRAATLLHALLSFGRKVDEGQYPPVVEDKELVQLSPLHRLFRHTVLVESNGTKETNPSPDSRETASPGRGKNVAATTSRLHYHEGVRHIIVARGKHLYKMEVVEPGGRILESSEILKAIQWILEDEQSVPASCAFDFSNMSALPLEEYLALRSRISEETPSNAQCFADLDSAILLLDLSTNGAETVEDPTFAVPTGAWSYGNVLSLHVYPNGNAVLKGNALVTDGPILVAAAQSIAHDANCDPMLEYRHAPPDVITTMKRHTRVVSPQPGKKPAKKPEEEVYMAPVEITLPLPEAVAEPFRLPLWMPHAFCVGTPIPAPPIGPTLVNVSLNLKQEASLLVAVLFAMKTKNPLRFPLVHLVRHSAVRDPTLQMCVTNEVESALRHVGALNRSNGLLRTEVERACCLAVDSVTQLLQNKDSHVSDFATLLAAGLLSFGQHKRDVLEGHLMGLADIHVTRMPAAPSSTMWSLRTPLRVDPAQHPNGAASPPPPMLCYRVEAGGRSSLRTSLGSMCHCSLSVMPSHPLAAEAEELMQHIQLLTTFIDGCVSKVRRKP